MASFTSTLAFPKNTVDTVTKAIEAEWIRRQEDGEVVARQLGERIQALRREAELTILTKIKFLSSETAIKYMKDDLLKIERQVEQLLAENTKKLTEEKPDMKHILQMVKKLLEHHVELYEKQIDPIKKAQFFRLFFKDLPTYADLDYGTQKTPRFYRGKSDLRASKDGKISYGDPKENRTPIAGMKTRCPDR